MIFFKYTHIVIILLFGSYWSFSQTPEEIKPENSVLVGAIRWDAWIGDLGRNVVAKGAENIGLQVERSLSPNRFHYRAPFYSKVISNDSIQCRATTQEIIDQEIIYAKNAGLDYWAFCWYPFNSGLETARELYLTSKLKDDIKWCIILGTGVNSTCPFCCKTDGAWLVNRFKETNYQKVLDGRPLVYVYDSGIIGRDQIDYLRAMCKDNNLKDPYIVLMSTDIATADRFGADAQSRYNSGAANNGGPYYPFVTNKDQELWNKIKIGGRKVIPWVTAGNNIKPRIDNPVGWMNVPQDWWVSDGTPEEIAKSVSNAIEWVKMNRSVAEANAVIIYAWNEFDEGGYLCPTLSEGTARLDALQKVLSTH